MGEYYRNNRRGILGKKVVWLSALCGCRPLCKRAFDLQGVIVCGLLSGLCLRHFQKPLAGMVIRGSGPNLFAELCFLFAVCSGHLPGFPDPDLFDHFAHAGRRLLTPLTGLELIDVA